MVITPERYPTIINGFDYGASWWFPLGPGCMRMTPTGPQFLRYDGWVVTGDPANDNGFLGVVS